MKCITTLKKIFGLSCVHLLLLQPLLLGSSIARAESAASRMKSKKIVKRAPKPVAAPAIPASAPVQIEQAEDESRKPRSIAGRKEEKGGFEKNVEIYATKVKNTYGLKDPGVKPFADAISKIKSHDSLAQIKRVVQPLKVAVNQAEQHLGVALLLKASLPLGKQEREIICEVLHKLDNYISYWREQKHHPIKYYFHKSPQKWFMGQKQKHEIEENIHFLVGVRDNYLRLLTKLSNHENAFNPESSIEEQYLWLAKYLSTINSVCFAKKPFKIDELTSYQNSYVAVCELLAAVPNHEQIINTALGNARKPGHFTRNWLRYTGLAIGSVMLASYANRNQEKFYNWFNTDVKDGAAYIRENVWGKVTDLYKALIGKGVNEEEAVNYDQLQQDFDAQLNVAQQNLEGVRDALRDTARDIHGRVNRHYPPAQEQARQENLNQASINAIANYLEGRDVLVQNRTLPQLPEVAALPGVANNNNAAPQQVLNDAAAQLRDIVRNAVMPEPVDGHPLTQEQRALFFRGALERTIGNIAQEQRPQALSAILREVLTQAIADIQIATGTLQEVQGTTSNWRLGRIMDGGAEIAGKLPQLAGTVALFGHVAAIVRVTTQEVSNGIGGFGGTGANVVGNLADFMNTIAATIGQVERIRVINGVQHRVMEPGPLRAGMASGIDLAKKADQLLKQNQATFILAALIPAGVVVGGTCFGASKMYNAFKFKPDFQPIREALIDIGHLLNEDGLAKSPEQDELDQGKIIYLVWKLEREAHNVPVLQRDQFKADVSRIGKNDTDRSSGKRVWTSDKKLRIIDLMYRTYDFLSPTYVVQ